MSAAEDAKVIGYFAYSSPTEVVCDGDACIIAGSDADLRAYISELGPAGGTNATLKKTRFGEIMRGMRLGAPYAFDETAYNRFYPLARREGFELDPETSPLLVPAGGGTLLECSSRHVADRGDAGLGMRLLGPRERKVRVTPEAVETSGFQSAQRCIGCYRDGTCLLTVTRLAPAHLLRYCLPIAGSRI